VPPGFVHQRRLALDALARRCRRADEGGVHREAPRQKTPWADDEVVDGMFGARVDVDADRVGARGSIEIDADQRAPAAFVDGKRRDGAIEGADVDRGIGRRDDGEDD
jgi:hypothetical protein